MDHHDLFYSKYILKPEQPNKRPINKGVIGFDIETSGRKNKFVLGCFIGDGIKREFWDKDSLLEWLNTYSQLWKRYIIVATNLGFDGLEIFNGVKNVNIMEKDGKLYGIRYYPEGKNIKRSIRFYDTMNYVPFSVEKLGQITGIKKLDHPSCFSRMPKNDDEREELKTYCYNDAYISQQFMKNHVIKWLNEVRVPLKYTSASIALSLFKKQYLDKIYRVHSHESNEIVFKGYYGGRTECFKRGTYHDINCYDFNSLYPSVMLNEYPDPNTIRYQKESNIRLIDQYEGVSYIEGFMPQHYIPLLPMKIEIKHEKKLIFPVNNIKGHYNHIEIRKALECGLQISKYGTCCFFTDVCRPFYKYVKDLYNKRTIQKENNDPMELMTKLAMNSLYGKFAFNYTKKSSLIRKDMFDFTKHKDMTGFREFLDYIEIQTDNNTVPARYSMPIWSSYCTSYARLKLFEFLGKQKYHENILYCDTDSIFLKDGQKLPNSDELGELKHEYSCDEGVFIRPKFYHTIKPKIKGIKGIKTKDEFMGLLDKRTIKQERFTKLRTSIRSKPHHKFGVLGINEIIDIEKRLNLNDSKRWWFDDFDYRKQQDSSPIFM